MAIPGADGRRAAELLRGAQSQGAWVLADVTRRAVRRLLARGAPLTAGTLYDAAERAEVEEALAATNATADLLGRSRVRLRQQAAVQARGFAEEPGWAAFDEGAEVIPLAPEAAVNFFKGLVPTLGVDPQRFGADQRRKAFTLAVAVDQQMLQRVKGVLQRSLEEGTGSFRDIDKVLTDAGVHPANPQYSDMAFRTSMLDAYNEGQWQELQDPELQGVFPVWQYQGISDGRQGDDHEPNFGKYFSNAVPFASVRGARIWNCRCSFAPVDAEAWRQLQEQGATLER